MHLRPCYCNIRAPTLGRYTSEGTAANAYFQLEKHSETYSLHATNVEHTIAYKIVYLVPWSAISRHVICVLGPKSFTKR